MAGVQHLVIIPSEPIATIRPELHGGFAEHLGELVYPGLWVGEGARTPNTGGLRDDVVSALRRLALPVLRWPGGNFADSYRWRDGIGPREQRPLRVNTQWGNAPETNHFGTHEFVDLCRVIGSEPYFAANVGSETPAYARDWVEYCNFAGPSALAAERAGNGHAAPFRVRYWGVGNENWGAGGTMGPEHYAAEYCKYRTFLHEYSGTRPYAIASGPNGGDWEWTTRFFRYLAKNHWERIGHLDAFSLHHYVWNIERGALEIDGPSWYETLTRAYCMDALIEGHRTLMDAYDPERRVALVVDEWGAWHRVDAGKPSHGLYQQNTVRDAVIAAITLDVLNQRSNLVSMANIAQIVNVLHSLILANDDSAVLTPTYHVFDLYRAHRGARAVRCDSASDVLSSPDVDAAAERCRSLRLDRRPERLRRVLGSASVDADGWLTATAVNTHCTEPCELELAVIGAELPDAEVVQLRFEALADHNTFDRPDAVGLTSPAHLRFGSRPRLELRPGAIVRVRGRLR